MLTLTVTLTVARTLTLKLTLPLILILILTLTRTLAVDRDLFIQVFVVAVRGARPYIRVLYNRGLILGCEALY